MDILSSSRVRGLVFPMSAIHTHFARESFKALAVTFMALLVLTITVIAPVNPAHAKNTKYAAFVIHADSGDILFDRYSTQSRYPASLTKMMTLYLLFEELEAGRLTLKSKLKVSTAAAGQPPSKLGVTKGSTIDVETAIKALVVKSANDVAVVVAERISGSEWKFARKMTTRARQIGMRKTTFRNASGLPNSKQVTTARDMAELSRRLFHDFPQYKHYFTTKKFTWKKRTFTTHNSLVKNYPGANGIKTGYTRRSGFNLATSAIRDDQNLIGIVLGGRSSHTRDKHMREILDNAFAEIKRKPQLIASLHRNTPTPRLKPSPYGDTPTLDNNVTLQANLQNAADGLTADIKTPGTTQSLDLAQHDRIAKLIKREDNSYGIAEGDSDGSSISRLVSELENTSTSPKSFISPVTTTNNNLNWSIQIGAYSTQQYASKELEKAAVLAQLTKIPRDILPLTIDNRPTLYRARFFYSNKAVADSDCDKLKTKGIGCFVTSTPTGAS